jgi:Mlc titration factor MtfA (ptsG expression regulator)
LTTLSDIGLNPSELDEFYTKYFGYYNTLNSTGKKLFVQRCGQFISDKEINGAGNFNPDNRIKALIAASSVQLTLGLEVWSLSYFEEIIVHSSDFENEDGSLRFSGETNLKGFVQLSWTSFMKGYTINDDNINLGLHEFSHALRFNSIRGGEQDYFIENYFNSWLASAYDAFYDIKNNRETIFRKYGGTNISEFLSVCIEHYFESPEEIREKYPLLYYSTGILLNQSSMNRTTTLGVRPGFFAAKNKLLAGFTRHMLQSSFTRHWTFKLWLLVSFILMFNIVNAGFLNSINLGLLIMFTGIYVWYDYNAIKIEFEKTHLHVEKGSGLFRKRKEFDILVSNLVSVRTEDEELIFTYYYGTDNFFYEERINSPKGGMESLLKECASNKIALLK